jgi:D-psicose/D-tagatose/L-ribulose 3-epimerase
VVAAELSNNLAVWRGMWDDGEDLARHAHRYLSVQLTAA